MPEKEQSYSSYEPEEIENLRLDGAFAPALEERFNAIIDEMVAYAEVDWRKELNDGFLEEDFPRIVSRRVTLWENELNTVLSQTGEDLRIRIRYNMKNDELHVSTRDFD